MKTVISSALTKQPDSGASQILINGALMAVNKRVTGLNVNSGQCITRYAGWRKRARPTLMTNFLRTEKR